MRGGRLSTRAPDATSAGGAELEAELVAASAGASAGGAEEDAAKTTPRILQDAIFICMQLLFYTKAVFEN